MEKQSKAKRIKILFKKQKTLMKHKRSLAEFKQPILILIRTNQKAEYFEDATSGIFEYQPTDKNKKDMERITLQPSKLINFDYGEENFKGYIHQEGDAFSYPHDPLMDIENYSITIQKTLSDRDKLEASRLRAMGRRWEGAGKFFLYFFGGIAIIITAFYLFYKPPPPTPVVADTIISQTPTVLNLLVCCKKKTFKYLINKIKP